MISWRNPDARHAAWGLDTYVQRGPGRARRGRARSPAASARCWSASAPAASSPASPRPTSPAPAGRTGWPRSAWRSPCSTTHDAGTAAALVDRAAGAAAAKAKSGARGYLDGRALAEVFAWLRPGDLIWNYWVNNYLLGKQAAGLRHPVLERRHHPDDRRAARRLRRPGDGQLAGHGRARSPSSACRSTCPGSTVDAYVVAGIADHITPWQNCYRSTQLLGGDTRFVLSTSGHIAALVNPPGNPKASFQTNKDNPADPQQWLAGRRDRSRAAGGPTASAWLGERCGAEQPAPDRARRRRPAPARRGARHLRLRQLKGGRPCTRRIGRSRGTDYFRIADQLTAEERDYWRRTRRLRRRRGAAGHQRLLGARRVPVAAGREAGRARASSATASRATAARR